jgi:hypothetical protein
MSDTVILTLKSRSDGAYNFESSATLSDGDILSWEEVSVIFHIWRSDSGLIAIPEGFSTGLAPHIIRDLKLKIL